MNVCNSALKVVLVVLLLCVGLSVQEINPARAERVGHFDVSPTKDFVSWRAFGRSWNVALELSQVVEDNQDYFIGSLEGDSSAVVSFSLLPGLGLSGMIALSNETYWIQALAHPASRGRNAARPEGSAAVEAPLGEEEVAVYMYRESSTMLDMSQLPSLHDPIDMPPAGEDEEEEEEEVNEEGGDGPVRRKRAVSVFKVALYYDDKWASSKNPWRSQADTLSLLNDVNAIYKAAGLAQFTFKYQKQITNPKTTINDMFTYWTSTQAGLLSTFKDTSYTNQVWLVGSNVGGLAYVGTSCKPTNAMKLKTAVCGLVEWSRLFTIKTIAHELGHNRGAPHDFTNQCSGSTKTGCQCSLMSYCFPSSSNNPNGAKNFLSQSSINSIKAAGCL
jgi:hypothetical protein